MSFPPYATPPNLANTTHYGSVGEHSSSSAGSASNGDHWAPVTSVSSTLEVSNGIYTGQRQAEQLGAVIRYQYATAPSTGFGWSYGPGLDHLRFPTPTPETLVQLTQPAYPLDSGSSEEKRLTTIPTSLPWPIPIKEEPEDLTGRSANHVNTVVEHTGGGGAESDSDSSSSGDQVLYIADEAALIGERERPGLSGAQKRKQKTPLVVSVNNHIGIGGMPLALPLPLPPAPLPEKRIPLPLPPPQNLPGPVRVLTAKDGAKMYSCPECNLFYADQLAFEVHLQGHGISHGKRHVCKECGTSFRRREHLDAHMTAHSEDRPYSCETCGKAFKRNEHLTRHRVLHTGDKPHTCPDCGKSFFRKDHLTKHAHTHAHAVHRKLTLGEG